MMIGAHFNLEYLKAISSQIQGSRIGSNYLTVN